MINQRKKLIRKIKFNHALNFTKFQIRYENDFTLNITEIDIINQTQSKLKPRLITLYI